MKRIFIPFALFALLTACTRQKASQKTSDAVDSVKQTVSDAVDDVSAPFGKKPDDPAQREQERFDERWRRLRSFQAQQAAEQKRVEAQQAAAAANIRFVKGQKETLAGLTPESINNAPVSVPISGDVTGPSVLKTQVYLDRADFSVGVLDGRWGRNSGIALWWFQRSRGLPSTGEVDEATFSVLAGASGASPAVVPHQLTADDLKGPFVTIPEDVYDKAKLDCLCYESVLEKLAETFHTTADFLKLLNPAVDFDALQAGQTLNVPNVRPATTADQLDVAKVVISIAGNTFNAFDAAGRLLFHAPTTLGSEYDPSPTETLSVKSITRDPNFHYQPTLFHEVPDSDLEANLSPGPNSPVGPVWIALTKPHYGIHGTSDPDSIGYASSHGCVRLTNWDAREISHRLSKGVPIEFVDTRHESE